MGNKYMLKKSKTVYNKLNSEISNLLKEFDILYNMPSIESEKQQLWEDCCGDDIFNRLNWLIGLQQSIAELVFIEPPELNFYKPSIYSIDEKYKILKECSAKIFPFMKLHFEKCGSRLKKYIYNVSLDDLNNYEKEFSHVLKSLEILETLDEEYKKRKRRIKHVWKKILEKYEKLQEVVESIL